MLFVLILTFLTVALAHASLQPLIRSPLKLGSVQAKGWFARELEIEAKGLAGHLHNFWPDIQNSSWLGGVGDQGLRERLPYWLNGIVPLLFQINTNESISLMEDVTTMFEYILQNQNESGLLGPLDGDMGEALWGRYDMILSLLNFADGVGGSKANDIFNAVYKFLHYIDAELDKVTLKEWSASRWADLVLSLQMLVDLDEKGDNVNFLINLMKKVKGQGFDWTSDWFNNTSKFPQDAVSAALSQWTHGVNNGQAIKMGAVLFRFSGNQIDLEGSLVAQAMLDKYHGQVNGMFGCDEHLAGKMANRGTELCTVVETMFSEEIVYTISGDGSFLDKLEFIAYNALPSTMSNDMWAHQYLQQTNQFQAVHADPHTWFSDGPDAVLFGLEPNYGCCTANFNQGWSKFGMHLIHYNRNTQGRTLFISVWAPFEAKTAEGVITVVTEYPFDDFVVINSDMVEATTLSFRIPSHTNMAKITSSFRTNKKVSGGQTVTLSLPKGSSSISISFEMQVTIEKRFNNAIAVRRGPLLFALNPKEQREILKTYAFQSSDFAIHPKTAWNYALEINSSDISSSFQVVKKGSSSIVPFDVNNPSIFLKVKGMLVKEWIVETNAAAAPPLSPIPKPEGTLEELILVPYGIANLHMAELPYFEATTTLPIKKKMTDKKPRLSLK